MSGDIFGYCNQRGANIIWVKIRDADKHPTMYTTAPTKNNYLAKNVNSSEVEKLARFRGDVTLEERKSTVGGARGYTFTQRLGSVIPVNQG